jgi:hypothetical protein
MVDVQYPPFGAVQSVVGQSSRGAPERVIRAC